MSRIKLVLQKIGRFLAIFVLGGVLFFTTACNNGDVRGARPENPPVQMGGNNNPHKMGGDGYTNYKASTDPRAKDSQRLRSSADGSILIASQAIDNSGIKSNAAVDLIYPGSNATTSNHPDIGPRGEALEPEPFPAEPQGIIRRSDPNERILEKIGRQFEDASAFLKDGAEPTVDKVITND